MPGQCRQFAKSVIRSSATMSAAVGMLVALAWPTVVKSQQPSAQPAGPLAGQTSPALGTPTPKPETGDASATTSDDPQALFPHSENTRYWLTGQANFIYQTHPPFDAAYSGKNSLNPNYEKAASRVMTLYTAMPLND